MSNISGASTKVVNFTTLLAHVRELVGHRSELLRATGEHFNIFQILGLGHYEVSTHSAMLCNLLSPHGSHGQRAAFLKCFINTLGLDSAFDADSALAIPEVSIGPRTDTTGGRLDILITDKAGRQIAIENKIHAGEQENWVRRYLSGLRPDANLIYLTLDGSSPEEMDDADSGKVMCVSYASSIVKWLEECRKEAATVPIVREGLTQYIHLIQHLTHQNTNSRMTEEIVKSVLANSETFDAFCVLRDTESAIKGRIVCDFGRSISAKLPRDFKLTSSPKGNCERFDGFTFESPELKARNLKAVVSFDSKQYGNCFVGFELIDRNLKFPESANARLQECFRKQFVNASCGGPWPAWIYWPRYQHWDNEVLRLIAFDGAGFEQAFIAVVEDMFQVARAFVSEMGE